MEHCCGQAAMVHADHVNSWWGVELLIPLLKHTKYFYFSVKSMCRPMPTRGKSPPAHSHCASPPTSARPEAIGGIRRSTLGARGPCPTPAH